MTAHEHYERHFDDNRVITMKCEECEQDDILTTVNFTVLDNEAGNDETFEKDFCNNCIHSLKKNNNIIINQIR